ncbi:hypothetical protein NCCP1664_00340 [Zafaria cholistanensis]|uniref:Uncharacterized protein n=1 Tax=Zafaria cholistanensis TaxID=1682741 RepID=A0A5A7NN98_9MICC|nr:hypothetical protein [Zafaria cholistanensis]GER21537.1 hypothetical protein NCCP1664_00340 [Zafaria cholistanensis]
MKDFPWTLRTAVWWWSVSAAALLVLAAATFGNAQAENATGPAGLFALSVFLLFLGLVVGYGAWHLFRGRLAGRGLLTTFGLIAGLPLLFRGPRLSSMAVALLAGVVLLWLPPSLRHFKAQAAAARAQRKAARKAAGTAR